MDAPLSYLDGEFLPASQMAIPVSDAGFALGTTVTEQLRTFSGQLFYLEEHLKRFYRSLHLVGITLRESSADLVRVVERIVAENWQLGDAEDDLGLSLFATPGTLATFNEGHRGRPCVGVHTYRLPFGLWADKYQRGQNLVVTDVQQVPTECWPAELKCRSRMHYYLADQKASAIESGARALLINNAGSVLETSTANILLYRAEGKIITPPIEDVLPGISLKVVHRLATELGLEWNHSTLCSDDIAKADEVFLSSTPFCLLPATSINGQTIGSGLPGSIFQSLIRAWSQEVGIDMMGQAQQFADR